MISLDDVRRAAARLDGVAHRTPVLTSRTLDAAVNAQVFLKAESLQRVGAFKFRGAYNKLATLPDEERARGVAAVSSGNHAQAVALAASLLDVEAAIIMPTDAPANKLAATRGYGAEIVPYDRYGEEREDLLDKFARERGLTVVHPFDDPEIMAGQGTVALELHEQAGPLDVLVVPLGGGGLMAGCATAIKGVSPDTKVIGVEPEAGDKVRRSLQIGRRVSIDVPRTIADGQQTTAPGKLTFLVIQKRMDEATVASDEEIVEAMRFVFNRLRVVVEPSGATALAALLAGRIEAPGARIGVVLSGGNVDHERFCALMSR
jgi:threonine dehydratase